MTRTSRFWRGIKASILFILRRPKDAFLILLALAVLFLAWRLKREKTEEAAGPVPADDKKIVTVQGDRVIVRRRKASGPVIQEERYLPAEGHMEVVEPEPGKGEGPQVVIRDRGMTAQFGGGLVYSGRVLPELDVKWFYWRRYSLAAGATPEFSGLALSRHIDDFTPFRNLEVAGMVGLDWHGKRRIGIGVRMNF
ncbi:MAG: hypothetical protein HY548_02300 [Elusimicrobia bacterium]|nr:hypothetical protein [Elusimicrobiota bacterium]